MIKKILHDNDDDMTSNGLIKLARGLVLKKGSF